MTSVIGVLCVIFYVSAVLATNLFGNHPNEYMQDWFGSVGASAYTLFQIMTLESWSMGIVRPTMEHYPFAWLFFVPFIIVTSFAVLNLFIGIIVDAMQLAQDKDKNTDNNNDQLNSDQILIHEKLDRMFLEIEGLKKSIKNN